MDETTTITERATSTADDEERPILFLHQITRRFRQGDATLDILKGAELAVWAGQSVALVAPSGAGKSTLLHIAGLLEHADGGEVYIDAVANAPRILLADEPTGNLDVRTAERVFATLGQLVRASGLAAIVATHNLDIAAQMDRRVTIRDGVVVELA